jgi:hypothetical protein
MMANWLVGISIAVYRLLLLAYPVAFRREYEGLMLQAFQDMCRDAMLRRRYRGLLEVWACVLPDWLISIMAVRWSPSDRRGATRARRAHPELLRTAARRPFWGTPWWFSLLVLTIASVVFGMRYFTG